MRTRANPRVLAPGLAEPAREPQGTEAADQQQAAGGQWYGCRVLEFGRGDRQGGEISPVRQVVGHTAGHEQAVNDEFTQIEREDVL